MGERGQTFTLEAFVAAILLLATLTFALQAVTVSSNTASGGDAERRAQHVGLAEGALDGAVENGTLARLLRYWNATGERFHAADSENGQYISRPPPLDDANVTFGGQFVTTLATLFDQRQVRYNIDLHYRDASGARQTQRLVEFGTPNREAVRVVETVTLYDDDPLLDESGDPRNVTLAELDDGAVNGTFYAPDAASDSPVYSVVRIEVVLWQS